MIIVRILLLLLDSYAGVLPRRAGGGEGPEGPPGEAERRYYNITIYFWKP